VNVLAITEIGHGLFLFHPLQVTLQNAVRHRYTSNESSVFKVKHNSLRRGAHVPILSAMTVAPPHSKCTQCHASGYPKTSVNYTDFLTDRIPESQVLSQICICTRENIRFLRRANLVTYGAEYTHSVGLST
jgi:hypothetical protein